MIARVALTATIILTAYPAAGSGRDDDPLWNRIGFERLDDEIIDPRGASGTLFVVVASDGTAAVDCAGYEVIVRF